MGRKGEKGDPGQLDSSGRPVTYIRGNMIRNSLQVSRDTNREQLSNMISKSPRLQAAVILGNYGPLFTFYFMQVIQDLRDPRETMVTLDYLGAEAPQAHPGEVVPLDQMGTRDRKEINVINKVMVDDISSTYVLTVSI